MFNLGFNGSVDRSVIHPKLETVRPTSRTQRVTLRSERTDTRTGWFESRRDGGVDEEDEDGYIRNHGKHSYVSFPSQKQSKDTDIVVSNPSNSSVLQMNRVLRPLNLQIFVP